MAGSSRIRILVVDDDATLRGVIARALEGSCVVDTAEDAASARRCLSEHAYDAVLCDVMMPDETGLDLLGTLPERDAGRLVFMTGGVVGADLLERLQRSGRPVLLKPFQLAALERVIAELVGPRVTE